MPPWATNNLAQRSDVSSVSFESPGAPAFERILQGLPSHRLAISPSLNAGMHVPVRSLRLAEVHMSPLPEQPFTAYVGIDWADTKHDICVQAAGESRRESGCIAHQVAAIDGCAKALHRRFGRRRSVGL